ncbi:MAG TPA: hypothetical protein VKX16_10130 [Chloroflexota bacterium]|nr:hypothetical protein [Chloroflexota bacterium]
MRVRHLLVPLLALASALPSAGQARADSIPPPVPGCPPVGLNEVAPIGQANPSQEPEPMYPIECAPEPMSVEPTTRIMGRNDWVDDFQTGVNMGNFEDGAMGYRVFRATTYQKGPFAPKRMPYDQLFVNQNHWMDDETVGFGFGAAISPNRSFVSENHGNGQEIVFEGDAAAGIVDYTAIGAHTELDLTTLSAPTGGTGIQGTLGGQFKPALVLQCPMSSRSQGVDCAYLQPDQNGKQRQIWSVSGIRQYSGVTVWGNNPHLPVQVNGQTYHLSDFFRTCAHNQMDMFCRDRFRVDITPTSLSVYVNAQLWEQVTAGPTTQIPGLPQGQLFPSSGFLDGSTPLYTYLGDWMGTGAIGSGAVVRFHMAHVAVNPHHGSGFAAPTAAPSFCLGDPGNTCPMS